MRSAADRARDSTSSAQIRAGGGKMQSVNRSRHEPGKNGCAPLPSTPCRSIQCQSSCSSQNTVVFVLASLSDHPERVGHRRLYHRAYHKFHSPMTRSVVPFHRNRDLLIGEKPYRAARHQLVREPQNKYRCYGHRSKYARYIPQRRDRTAVAVMKTGPELRGNGRGTGPGRHQRTLTATVVEPV